MAAGRQVQHERAGPRGRRRRERVGPNLRWAPLQLPRPHHPLEHADEPLGPARSTM